MKKYFVVALVLVAAVFIVTAVAERMFYYSFKDRARQVRKYVDPQTAALITDNDLKGLPEPVARYMRFSGVVGRKRISYLMLKHAGSFRMSPKQSFLPINGEYSLTTKKPSFLWYAKLKMAPFVSATVIDSYFNGKGGMKVKVMSVFTVVDAQSKETGASAFGRCIAEMTMTPTYFLDRDTIRWTQTGKDSAACAVADAGLSGEAELFVNADGSLDKITVMRYYDRGDGGTTLEKFSGKFSAYKAYNGYVFPMQLDGYWNLKEGDFHYVNFLVESIHIE